MKKKELSLISFKNNHEAIEVDEGSRTVAGYFASFGNKDSDDDIIEKGAFSKSIKDRGVDSDAMNKVAYLWQHDMKEPLGKLEVLTEDDNGLYFEAKVSDFELGDRVLAQYKDGTLNQHSIGFRYIEDKIKFDKEADAFIVKEVNLFEGSVVTLGANPNTPFTGIKGLTEAEQLKELEEFIKGLDLNKDDIFTLRKYFEMYKHLEPSIKDTLSRNIEGRKQTDTQLSDSVSLDYGFIINRLKVK